MNDRPIAVLLTGERGAGKSTVCEAFAGARSGVDGVCCPAIYDELGNKIGFSCRSLGSADERELGRTDIDLKGPNIGKYSLSREAIGWALEIIVAALKNTGSITVIDEIGPLELRQNRGFAPALPLLAGSSDIIIVVREDLIAELERYVPGHNIRVVHVTVANQNEIVDRLVALFKRITDPTGK